jgi:hypothetical protein
LSGPHFFDAEEDAAAEDAVEAVAGVTLPEDDESGGAGAPLSLTSRPKEIQERHFAEAMTRD